MLRNFSENYFPKYASNMSDFQNDLAWKPIDHKIEILSWYIKRKVKIVRNQYEFLGCWQL